MNRIATLALCLTLTAAPTFAAERCSFVTQRRGELIESDAKGSILLDGSRYRVELDPEEEPRGFDVLVSKDGGAHENGIDLARRTWYTLEPVDATKPSSPLLTLLPIWNEEHTAKNLELQVTEKPEPEMVSGRSARRYEIRLGYDVKIKYPGQAVRGQIRVNAVFWMVGDQPLSLPSTIRPEIRTSFPEIDSGLNEALAKLPGFPIRQEVTISAEAAQTLPRTSRLTVVLSDCEPVQSKVADFEVPAGFKYKKPVMVGPGMSR
jgi:hypothetical protein